jgi:hypothetical protein
MQPSIGRIQIEDNVDSHLSWSRAPSPQTTRPRKDRLSAIPRSQNKARAANPVSPPQASKADRDDVYLKLGFTPEK